MAASIEGGWICAQFNVEQVTKCIWALMVGVRRFDLILSLHCNDLAVVLLEFEALISIYKYSYCSMLT
jgi:hypothetical protein